ncbi:ATP-grasp domain-containing protein [Bacillus sp. FJAT-22090]|uniref:ATP-grasp domain-containing protein n=1 Tax=Bacillus sp. FJAT-22090 TaxID=1581038 RepID=UPI0011A243A4|nr:ATP-grasp domain-containing protein [Bacillus sp. FJAT-22090]
MVLHIWFNRWFSTVAHYMDMIRNNPDQQQFVIYGTHPNPDTVYFKNCDISGPEPDICGEEYIQFCLDYCIQNNIHIFVPRKENVLISQHLDKFEKIGVKVLVCPKSNLMRLMDDKAAFYRALENKEQEGHIIVQVPAYQIVTTANSFKHAYEALSKENTTLCIKPIVGEGASGFRIIDDTVDTVPFLFSTAASQRISYETVYKTLSSQEHFPELMVIEYLDGYEYSIDCLADSDGGLLAAIPRKKGQGRIQEIVYNEELIRIAEKMAEHFKIPYVFNIQIRYKDGVPKLLEINPRMSGGLHISCLTDINIPYYAVKLLLGGKMDSFHLQYDVKATYLEQSVVLRKYNSVLPTM